MVERKQKQNVKYEKKNKKWTKNIKIVAGHDNNNQLKKVSNFHSFIRALNSKKDKNALKKENGRGKISLCLFSVDGFFKQFLFVKVRMMKWGTTLLLVKGAQSSQTQANEIDLISDNLEQAACLNKSSFCADDLRGNMSLCPRLLTMTQGLM